MSGWSPAILSSIQKTGAVTGAISSRRKSWQPWSTAGRCWQLKELTEGVYGGSQIANPVDMTFQGKWLGVVC